MHHVSLYVCFVVTKIIKLAVRVGIIIENLELLYNTTEFIYLFSFTFYLLIFIIYLYCLDFFFLNNIFVTIDFVVFFFPCPSVIKQ